MPSGTNQIHDQEGYSLPVYSPGGEDKDLLSELDLLRFWHITYRNWFWITAILLTSILLSWTYLRYTKPVFQSSSILKIENKNDAVVLGLEDMQTGQSGNNLRNLSGEIEFIRSKLVFEKTLERLPIDVSVFADGNLLNEEKYKNPPVSIHYKIKDPRYYNFRFDLKLIPGNQFQLSYKTASGESFKNTYKFGDTISTPAFRLSLLPNIPLVSEHYNEDFFFIIHSKSSLIQYLEDNLQVEILNIDANTLQVSFSDHDPVKAHDIVATIDSVYMEQSIVQKTKTQEQTLAFLDENLESTEARLTVAERRLESFMKENKTVDVKSDVARLVEKIEQLDNKKIGLRLNITLLNDLQDLIVSDQDLKTFTPGASDIQDAQLIKMIEDLNELQQEKELALTRSKDNTYVVKSMNLSIDNLKEAILTSVSQNRKLLYQQLSEIDQQIRELEKSFLTLPGKETEYTRIKRFYDLYEKYYLLLMEKKAEYGIAKAGMVPNFLILAPAELSKEAIFPKKLYVYPIGFALGLLFSFGLVILRYLFDNTITSQKELESSVAASILGGIPNYSRETLSVSRLIVNKGPKSSISEAFRSIRTNLDFVYPDKDCKILSVTSTISGEGKTFVALNLGGIIAMSEQKVLIIDLDMRKPKIHRAFDLSNDKGMSSVLIGKEKVADCIFKTELENLDFIPAGPNPPNPSELILRPDFQKTIKELKKNYDVIIFDTPPVGLVTDAVLIMKYADVPLYVVRANYSRKNIKNTVNKLVKHTGFSNLCVILNALNSFNSYGYGYGNNYGYGYYENDEKDSGLMEKLKSLLN